jgi:hypothetical protein
MSSTAQRRGAAGPDATGRPVNGRDIHGCAAHALRASTRLRSPCRSNHRHEPHLGRNTTVVPPPKTPEQGYHLSGDLADDAISWLRTHKATTASTSAPAWVPGLPGPPRTGALPVNGVIRRMHVAYH